MKIKTILFMLLLVFGIPFLCFAGKLDLDAAVVDKPKVKKTPITTQMLFDEMKANVKETRGKHPKKLTTNAVNSKEVIQAIENDHDVKFDKICKKLLSQKISVAMRQLETYYLDRTERNRMLFKKVMDKIEWMQEIEGGRYHPSKCLSVKQYKAFKQFISAFNEYVDKYHTDNK